MQRLTHRRVVSPETAYAEAGEHVEVAVALVVEEVAAFGALVDFVEPDRVQHPGHLRVDVFALQLVVLAAAGLK